MSTVQSNVSKKLERLLIENNFKILDGDFYTAHLGNIFLQVRSPTISYLKQCLVRNEYLINLCPKYGLNESELSFLQKTNIVEQFIEILPSTEATEDI